MILTTLSLGLEGSTGAPKVEALLARTREALGLGDASGAIELAGDGEVRGAPASFAFTFAADGRFLSAVLGPLGESAGFDGETAWSTDAGGLASPFEPGDDAIVRLWSLFLSGLLFRAGGAAALAIPEGAPTPGEIALEVPLPGGLRAARVAINQATALPKSLAISTPLGDETWMVGDWRPTGGRLVPHRIECRSASGAIDVYQVTRTGAPDATTAFGPDPSRGLGVFDGAVAPEVEVRLAPTGHLLVHPRVSGREVGWFILDTGASMPVITPEAADAAGLAVVGSTSLVGAGAESPVGRFRIGGRFALGPLAIDPIVFVEMDLAAAIGDALGAPIAGVIGFELFRRAVVVVDMTAAVVSIHDPATFALPASAGEAAWTPLVLHDRHPHVRGRFEGGPEGLFRLDTGAGSTAIVFHAPAIERRRLLEGREVADVSLEGAGGLAQAKMGAVKDFEIAGRKRESVDAIFVVERSGAMDDAYADGTIGGGLVGDLRLVFDYGRGRIAFLPR